MAREAVAAGCDRAQRTWQLAILGAIGHRLGRRLLADVGTIVMPDTILRWHREHRPVDDWGKLLVTPLR
jgi:hypothetical protein